MQKTAIFGGVLALLAVVAGVGKFLLWPRTPEKAYSDVNELVSDLERNGVERRDLTVSTVQETEDVGGEFGFCFIGQKEVNIHVYDHEERVESHVADNISVRGDTLTTSLASSGDRTRS